METDFHSGFYFISSFCLIEMATKVLFLDFFFSQSPLLQSVIQDSF